MGASNKTGETRLSAHFGTGSLCWSLFSGSDLLHLQAEGQAAQLTTPLSAEHAGQLRQLSGATRSVNVDALLGSGPIRLLLVGKQIDSQAWAGTAVEDGDMLGMQRALDAGLTFAEQVVSEVNSLVIILDREGKIKRFNRLCEEVTGFTEDQVVGRNAFDLFVDASERESSRNRVQDFFTGGEAVGSVRPINTKTGVRTIQWRNKIISSGSGVSEKYIVCSGTDITAERRSEELLRELANTDALTSLPNRHAIEGKIRLMTAAGASFGLIFLDLDNFKKVNDHYGHVTGDALLKKVANSLLDCVAPRDSVARLGGDEFLVIVTADQQQEVELVAERILRMMKKSVKLDRAEVYSGCSMGISLFPVHGTTFEELVRCADTAMYAAKEACPGTYQVFASEMDSLVGQFMWLESNFRKALDEEQFELYYQPKISFLTGAVESVEALLRWNHPVRGVIGPAEFIPYAEASGLIVPLGKWVIEAGARQAGQWKKEGVDIRVAINLSARQLRAPNLLETYTEAVLRNDLTPSSLDLELTESCLVDDEQMALRLIRMFRELGAQVHLDDFGTGYSSLSQLARLPLDVLKLDGTFIASINSDPKSRALVRAMVAVGHEMHLKIVAECVETEEQASFLKRIGVDFAQGYFFAKPMNLAAFEQWRAAKPNTSLCLVA